jgi:Fur family ferric uptake transcriptional regulator
MAVFEINHGTHHDHIVCMDCGAVEEFVDPEIETRQNAIAKRLGYRIEEHSLVLYGRCQRPDCAARKLGRVKRVI